MNLVCEVRHVRGHKDRRGQLVCGQVHGIPLGRVQNNRVWAMVLFALVGTVVVGTRFNNPAKAISGWQDACLHLH